MQARNIGAAIGNGEGKLCKSRLLVINVKNNVLLSGIRRTLPSSTFSQKRVLRLTTHQSMQFAVDSPRDLQNSP